MPYKPYNNRHRKTRNPSYAASRADGLAACPACPTNNRPRRTRNPRYAASRADGLAACPTGRVAGVASPPGAVGVGHVGHAALANISHAFLTERRGRQRRGVRAKY